jgi:hypothetical protein
MNANEVTKEDVNEWTDDEVAYWFNKFSKDEQAAQMRKHILDQIEVREASGPRILPLHVASKVIS